MLKLEKRHVVAALGACLVACASSNPEMAEAEDAAKKATDDIGEGCRTALAKASALRQTLQSIPKADRSVASVFGPYNELWRHLSNALGDAELMGAVHPDPARRSQAEACDRALKAFANKVTLDRAVYEAVAGVDVSSADAGAKRFAEKALLEFRLSGVDKDEATRKQLEALHGEMVELGQKFSRAIREDVRKVEVKPEQLDGLPEDFIAAHPAKDGKVTLTTNYPDFFPIATYAKDEAVRRELTKAFLSRAYPDNEKTLVELLRKRHQYATLLGFESWADYVAKDKMSGSAKTIRDFTEQIADIARPRMEKDLEVLLAAKKKDVPDANAIQTWDRFYYVQKVQAEQFGFDAAKARAYFAYPEVKKGILALYGELFGLEFKKVEREVWHPSVEAFEMSRGGELVGKFFFDMHPRDGKYGHAAMFPIRIGIDGGQLPEASLVCNFPDPSQGSGLMDHGQVKTFFHEFGHLIHHLLARGSKWSNQSGINTEWDFVEAPSQILEEWSWSTEVLQRFAKHHETGEPIPAELVEKMRAASEFGIGVHIMRQVHYQAMSFYLHDGRAAKDDFDLFATAKDLQAKYSPYPYAEGTHVYASFGHLNGYSAIYYTYQWSLALAKDMFTRFQKNGLMDGETARAYADEVLVPGGSKPAAELVKSFLGRPYNLDAYKKWLQEG
ncbi:MAG: M3 family metallopeptidase [Deltaproteobacteria bacterium]